MRYKAKHPLVVVGLDGGTFNVIRPLIKAGKLPNIAEIIGEGWQTELLSTIPTATLPAWSSFLTSASPSQHGVVDLFVRQAGTYALTPGSGALRQLPTLAWRLSQQGYRVCSLGVPGTFPPEPIKGLNVSGFDSPSANQAGPESVFPPNAFSKVKAAGGWGYNVFNEHKSSTKHLRGAADCILKDLSQKEKTVLNLFSGTAWDLFMVHLQASDTTAHHFWHWYDKESPRRPKEVPLDILTLVYERLDQLIGKLKSKLPKGGRLLLVSDHGFGGASTQAVYLNRWLHQMGYLTFLPQWKSEIRGKAGTILRSTLKHLPNQIAGWAQKSLKGDLKSSIMGIARGTNVNYQQSIAFSDEFDYAPSLWLNHEGFFPHGRVSADNAAGVRKRLKEDLLKLRTPKSGHAIFNKIYCREELASGPASESLPDLILEPAWPNGYRPCFLTSNGPGEIIRNLDPSEFNAPKGFGMPGVHQREGIFMAWGEGISPLELPTLEIEEAGSLVYPLMGAEIPPDLPTAPPDYLQELIPYRFAPETGTDHPAPTAQEANPALTERLRAMGYID